MIPVNARRISGLLAASVALAVGMSISCSAKVSVKAPERIILIVVDTLRRDHVSAYVNLSTSTSPSGSAESRSSADAARTKTPNIDRLAATGQIFRNAVSAFHATTMSMAAIFTGLTPSIETGTTKGSLEWNTFAACGMSRYATPTTDDACLPHSVETLAEDLRGAGYWTIGVVSNELLYRPSGYDQGFDDWVEVGPAEPGKPLNILEASAIRTARRVNRDVIQAVSRRPRDRFFLYVHYLDVHDWTLFGRSYEESVQRFDARLGDLLDKLAELGLLEDATVVLTADHGEMLVDEHLNMKVGGHFGNPSFQPVLEIPLIVSPAIKSDDRAMIRSQDLRSIIREIASLEPIMTTELEPGELFVSEMTYQTYRKGRWKSMWARSGALTMLFDLEADPRELVDLATSRTDILESHRQRIDQLAHTLASDPSRAKSLDEKDLDRLRALGYFETTTDAFKDRAAKPGAPESGRERTSVD